MTGVKELELVERADEPAPNALALFERWATDPNASVEKIERLMALWERGEARKAEAAFNAAMTAAQAEMRPVAADADNPQTRSRYASYAALDRALRPIYTKHGFGLSFNTGEARDMEVRVLCHVTHAAGHSRDYHLDMPADGKGAKGGDVMTRTHATGSALSYGTRYLLKLIFNVAVGEDDDDGQKASRTANGPAAPPKFDDWLMNLEAVAVEGMPKLQETWKSSAPALKEYLVKTNPQKWEAIKKVAAMKGGGK